VASEIVLLTGAPVPMRLIWDSSRLELPTAEKAMFEDGRNGARRRPVNECLSPVTDKYISDLFHVRLGSRNHLRNSPRCLLPVPTAPPRQAGTIIVATHKATPLLNGAGTSFTSPILELFGRISIRVMLCRSRDPRFWVDDRMRTIETSVSVCPQRNGCGAITRGCGLTSTWSKLGACTLLFTFAAGVEEVE
jgi:hypothetical protein